MDLLKRILGTSDSSETSMPKGAEIYYSPKGLLIATKYGDARGFFGGGEPMVLLPLNSAPREIGEHVLEAVAASECNLSKEELAKRTKAMFNLAGARGWNDLEKNWDKIHASGEPERDNLHVLPLHRYEKGGYGGAEDDPAYECELNADEIGRAIRTVLDGPPPEVLRDDPSHT